MIIEFYALPGSGKSTITNLLVPMLREKGYKVTSQNDYTEIIKKIPYCLKKYYQFISLFILLNNFDILIESLLKETEQTKTAILKRWYFICIKKRYHKYVIKKTTSDFYILDDYTPYLTVWSLYSFQNALDIKSILRVISILPKSDIFILAEIEIQEIASRLSKRPGKQSSLNGFSYDESFVLLKNRQEIFVKIDNIITEIEKKTIRINFNKPAEENASFLLKELTKYENNTDTL